MGPSDRPGSRRHPRPEKQVTAPALAAKASDLTRRTVNLPSALAGPSLPTSPGFEKCSLISKIKELNLAPYYSHK